MTMEWTPIPAPATTHGLFQRIGLGGDQLKLATAEIKREARREVYWRHYVTKYGGGDAEINFHVAERTVTLWVGGQRITVRFHNGLWENDWSFAARAFLRDAIEEATKAGGA